MKVLRLFLAVALVSLAVGACSDPTTPYPQPDDQEGKQDPPPAPGLVVTVGR